MAVLPDLVGENPNRSKHAVPAIARDTSSLGKSGIAILASRDLMSPKMLKFFENQTRPLLARVTSCASREIGAGRRPGGDGAAPYLPQGGRRHDTMLHRTAPGPATATGIRCWFRTRRAGWWPECTLAHWSTVASATAGTSVGQHASAPQCGSIKESTSRVPTGFIYG